MLRYTVLIVRLEHANHIRIVSICPYSRFGYVLGKVLLRPKYLTRSRRLPMVCIGAGGTRTRTFGLEERPDGLEDIRLARCRRAFVLALCSVVIFPRRPRMTSQAMHEDDAVTGQYNRGGNKRKVILYLTRYVWPVELSLGESCVNPIRCTLAILSRV